MISVTLYVSPECTECDRVLADLNDLQKDVPHHLVVIDTQSDPALDARYGKNLPVVEMGPYRLWFPFKKQDLLVMLKASGDRAEQLKKVDNEGYQRLVTKGQTITAGDRISLWLSQYYMLAIIGFIFLYVGLPFLAPVLMKANLQFPARVIYKVYSPLCHQLAFRSWFLFGEQLYYPRELAAIGNVLTYEQTIGNGHADVYQARDFLGNDTVGYKVALCQRDIAIYGAMLLFAIVFTIFGRRFRAIRWYVWVGLGLLPIGFDGISQLPSLAINLPSWILMRESTPILRTVTGFMFGWITAWYLFPMMEESMKETRRIILRKKALVQVVNSSGSGV